MAAAAPRTRQLAGVPDGLLVVIRRAEQQQPQPPQEFLARAIRVGEAGGFLELLALEIPGVGLGGEVRNRVPLENVDRAAHLLSLLKDSIIPELRREPTKPSYLLVLEACARGLRVDAVAAGGSFSTRARAIAEFIEAFVIQARGHPNHAPYAPLRAAVDELRRRAESLLQSTCSIRHQAPVEAAADGAAEADQLGAAEEVGAHEEAAAAAQEAAAE